MALFERCNADHQSSRLNDGRSPEFSQTDYACYRLLMVYFVLDDSKHHGCGFSLSAFAICEADPQNELNSLFTESGFDPSKFKFKSSNRMKDNPSLQELRSKLRVFIQHRCRVAVCVVKGDENIDPASLRLLQGALTRANCKVSRQHRWRNGGHLQRLRCCPFA